jgi:DNA-3-methyladenine glycosylase I
MLRYHDEEWGLPVGDDRALFEKICLEGFQSGLSWATILHKREAFRHAFHGFDPERVARFTQRDVRRLLGDAGIVRHRGKIESAIGNARKACDLAAEQGSLAAHLWRFEPAAPRRPRRGPPPTTVPEAVALAKDLKRRGWTFVGPTTVYAFMQAVGMVNDHLDRCPERPHIQAARAAFPRPGQGADAARPHPSR